MDYNYRSEYIKCGKKGCKTCPHGPYWYGYYREGKKLKKKYFGKVDPRDVKRETKTRQRNPFDDIFLVSKRTPEMAAKILGISRHFSQREAKKGYHTMVKLHHPDRGGDPDDFKRVQAAWEYCQEMTLWNWW